ncbi:hypothetical protein BCR37DRAFT_379090 [Protomyces lactucae-debilis]|uniref:Uncharacterized protein n=1 Tax=Protomyces lactucae-debilis TaxID=2754530 RepID=A0A1Y2FJZ7_PROLT|nr:uncharacterized protein BCR37DRAFT_379090 [Protomyces lactucae-debilis]ORY83115.1 hypothetical protein BCR37DRAFT_379090 [Protomyces lactucae-debilis]
MSHRIPIGLDTLGGLNPSCRACNALTAACWRLLQHSRDRIPLARLSSFCLFTSSFLLSLASVRLFLKKILLALLTS